MSEAHGLAWSFYRVVRRNVPEIICTICVKSFTDAARYINDVSVRLVPGQMLEGHFGGDIHRPFAILPLLLNRRLILSLFVLVVPPPVPVAVTVKNSRDRRKRISPRHPRIPG